MGAGATFLFTPLAAIAQQPSKVPRIGFLGAASVTGYASQLEALRTGLRDLGYVEDRTIVIEFRWAEGKYDRLPDLAAELARLKVDVLLTHGTPGTLAAKRATTTTPIVMTAAGDAVASGVVASLARPGGNITGTTIFSPEIAAKRLELLKEIVPRTRRVAFLTNPHNPILATDFQATENAAKSMKMELERFEVRGPDEFDSAFAAMIKSRADAVMISQDWMLNANVRKIADLSTRKRLASLGAREFAGAGGLIGYGVNILEMFRRAAYFVDKILKGVRPADLPVERATKFELVINLKTAKALGLTIPQPILLRADVIQ
jgi:putative tryptophan/tyrosine transport system substrate-binding protein